MPAGACDAIDVLGTAAVHIGSGVQANRMNISAADASAHFSGGKVLSTITNCGAMATCFDLVGQSTWNIFGTAFGLGTATHQAGDTVTRANARGLFTVGNHCDLATLVVTLGDGSTDTVLVLASNGGNAVVPKWTGSIHFAAAPVPESPAFALLPAGLAVFAGLARRRRAAGLAAGLAR